MQLHEENELVWNDGVAPETCIDFDAPHVDKYTGLLWFMGGIAFFYVSYKVTELSGFMQNKKTAAREVPFSTMVAEGMYEQEKAVVGAVHARRSS